MDNLLATCAGHPGTDDPVHDEPTWNVFQFLGHILADRSQLPAAGAFIAWAQHGVVAGQFWRQWLALLLRISVGFGFW